MRHSFWPFGHHRDDDDARLRAAVDRVIAWTDPRLKLLGDAREKLMPAVAAALAYAREFVDSLPICAEMTAEAWGANAILRALFARPAELRQCISASDALKHFLASPEAAGLNRVFCVVAATRNERSVLGAAMQSGQLRQDVVRRTVGFDDFRLAGFARSEVELRQRIESLVLEGLALAVLRRIADGKERSDHLAAYRRLLLIRLRLLEQGGAGLSSLFDSSTPAPDEIERMHEHLRHELSLNEAELAALGVGTAGLDGILGLVADTLNDARALIQAQPLSLRLDAMNTLVGADADDAVTVDLLEFSTADAARPRRVAFLASFPRSSVVDRHVDFDAALRGL